MEQTKSLEYTIKIYGEGLTEWFYFDGIRTANRFRFSMVPDVPQNSRSSYKQNLKLIDKELKKRPEERADAIFLVIDTDTIVKDKKQFAIYQAAKEKYKKRGVTFIESHPCVELWFLYHMTSQFARTNYETYEALRPSIEKVLPNYEKTRRYYQTNRFFKDNIIFDTERQAQAISFAIKSCKYEAIADETVNSTELFKAIHFFRLLQKFAEIRDVISEVLRKPSTLQYEIVDHRLLWCRTADGQDLFSLRYKDCDMICLFQDGTMFRIGNERMSRQSDVIQKLVQQNNNIL